MPLAIEMKGITKRFPGGVIANDSVCFNVKHKEIHSLLGENGTGKTTLMNILFGLYQPDEGEIYINGKRMNMSNPSIALEMGLGMVHQHFMLIDRMTVLENVVLGHEHGKYVLDLEESYKVVHDLSLKYGFNLDLSEKVESLSVGMKQRVEILKTLYRGAEIIILDEPTAVLTPPEVDELFVILNELKRSGKTIIFITHKLNETMEIADSVTVLRKGSNVVSVDTKDTTPTQLARFMVGREVNMNLDKTDVKFGEIVLSLRDITLNSKTRNKINFDVREGEIFGIAGVEGNGQLELEEIIMGLNIPIEGTVLLNGQDITYSKTQDRKMNGIGHIPSDRHKRAMLQNFSLWENLLLGFHKKEKNIKNKLINEQYLKKSCEKLVKEFDIKTPDVNQSIGLLSGGNQQKVILAREVNYDPILVVAAQPIRGLDIGAIEHVHQLLLNLREQGKAIILISAELSEIMQLSDRIGVLYEGEFVSIKNANEYSREEIGLLMAGEVGKHNEVKEK